MLHNCNYLLRGKTMKIVVIGGTGVLGSKVVDKLRDHGDDAVAASPKTGVNTLTGEGLADALTGADVVVDVSNSPSFDDGPVMEFFTKSTTNLVATSKAAGVGHYVAVSMTVGDEVRVPDALIQPIAAAELAAEVARVAEGEPLGGIENIGGPEKSSFEQMAREVLARQGDGKTVVVD